MLTQTAPDASTDTLRDKTDPAQLIRVAICGEVSAGKSTVLNTMLREVQLPDNLGSDCRPVVHIRHGEERVLEITDANGRSARYDGKTLPRRLEDAVRLDLQLDQPHLQGFELIEMPITKAEELTEAQIDLVRGADVLVWVTIASQAWRLTEKTILETLGDARPNQGILAVSRADKLRSESDMKKLHDRMVRETSSMFDDCVFIKGARRDIVKSAASQENWAGTGGAKLLELLEALGQKAVADRAGPAASPEAVPAAEEAPEPVNKPEADSDVVDFARYVTARDTAPENVEPNHAEPPADVPEFVYNEAELRPLIDSLGAPVCLGLLRNEAPAACVVMAGEDDICHAIAEVCKDGLQTLNGAYPEDQVNWVVVAMRGNSLIIGSFPTLGTVFMLAGKDSVTPGMAQRTLSAIGEICAQQGEDL